MTSSADGALLNHPCAKVWTGDQLVDLEPAQALDAFRLGATANLAAVEGDLIGIPIRLQAMRRGSMLDRIVRRWVTSPRFPWEGKSFRAESADRGVGFNRGRTGPILTALPFKTYFAPSMIDQGHSLILDYDVPRNPWWQRPIFDELREISPGLFLCFSAYRVLGRKPILVWFGLEAPR